MGKSNNREDSRNVKLKMTRTLAKHPVYLPPGQQKRSKQALLPVSGLSLMCLEASRLGMHIRMIVMKFPKI